MAEIWYNIIPCCCDKPGCSHHVSAAPQVTSMSVVISVRGKNGKRTDVVLSAGWARVLAANIEQAANQVRPKIAPKPFKQSRLSETGKTRIRTSASAG
jgi:hypothetical protein